MKPPHVDMGLWIDGEPVSVGSVEFLYQASPWPGGHQCRFEIRGAGAAKALGRLWTGRREKLDRGEASRLMSEIEWLIAKIADVPRHSDYFVNTVDVLDVDAGAVVVEGECSPVIRNHSKPPPNDKPHAHASIRQCRRPARPRRTQSPSQDSVGLFQVATADAD